MDSKVLWLRHGLLRSASRRPKPAQRRSSSERELVPTESRRARSSALRTPRRKSGWPCRDLPKYTTVVSARLVGSVKTPSSGPSVTRIPTSSTVSRTAHRALLAEIDEAAGKRPFAERRFDTAPDQQHAARVDDDASSDQLGSREKHEAARVQTLRSCFRAARFAAPSRHRTSDRSAPSRDTRLHPMIRMDCVVAHKSSRCLMR